MNTDRLVAGLDIDSARTTAVIGEVVGESPRKTEIRVLGAGQARTTGIRRGVVADIEEATRSIRAAVEDAERTAATKVEEVYVSIAGDRISTMTSTGIVAVSGEEIRRLDVKLAHEVARAQAIPAGHELLHAIPQGYAVDGNTAIRDPVGMSGKRLETEVYLVTVPSSAAANLRKSVERAGCTVRELVLAPIASALAVLTEDEMDLGVVLIDIGAETTDLAMFQEEKVRHLGTIALGGAHIIGDVVDALGIGASDAERLMERYGCVHDQMVDPGDVIELPSTLAQGDRQIPRAMLALIIHRRMDEIFRRVQQEIAAAGYARNLRAGVVLTGSIAAIEGSAQLAAELLESSVRVGAPTQRLTGRVDSVASPRFSTAVGLVRYGARRMVAGAPSSDQKGAERIDGVVSRVRSWLRDYW